MKPLDNKDGQMQKHFADLDRLADIDPQIARAQKRVWKKARTRYLRRKGKNELDEIQSELD